MVEKGMKGGICHAIYWYAKANNKYMKNYDKNKQSKLITNIWKIMIKINNHNILNIGM